MPTDQWARRSSILWSVQLKDRQKFAEEKPYDLLVLIGLDQSFTYRGSGGNNPKFGKGKAATSPRLYTGL